MKMLYPRKIDDVLWHSATSLFSKSILVKIPKLPTIRVIGSQFISTRLRFFWGTSGRVSGNVAMAFSFRLVGRWTIASGQFRPAVPPSRFFVQRGIGNAAHGSDETAIGANHVRRKLCSWWLVHKRHELVGKAWHGASDADSSHIRTPTNAALPAALGNIAIDNRS